MQKLLNYTLQLIFYLHGGFALLLSLGGFLLLVKILVFFITFILSLIIGYFYKPLFYNNKFKEKNLATTILLSWLLLVLLSAIPLFSYMDILSISDIFFISTSFVTTTGFHHNLLVNLNYLELNIWYSFIQMLGGLLSILSYILFFLILFNKHNKFVVFNKSLVIKFIIYYFAVFFSTF